MSNTSNKVNVWFREFDYEMEYDEEWKLVEWYLQDFPKKNK